MGVPTDRAGAHRRRSGQPDHLRPRPERQAVPHRRAHAGRLLPRQERPRAGHLAAASPTRRTRTWSGARPACRTSALRANSRRPCTRPARASCCPTTARRRFNWKKNLNDKQIASFQEDLSALGYKYQFITLAGIHINWFNTFQFAHAYARGEGMKHYTQMVQEPEFAARDKGYTFVSPPAGSRRRLLRRRHHGDPGRLVQRQGADRLDRGRAVPLIR